jgi:hypothetical protein
MMDSRSPAAVAGASERVLDRGEKIELLVTRTEQLQDQSYRFSTESRRLKWSMCRDNYKLWAILVIVVIVRRFSLSLPLRCSVFFSSFPCAALARAALTVVFSRVEQIIVWLISSFICGFDYSKCS